MSKEIGINTARRVNCAEDLGRIRDGERQENTCRWKAPKTSNKTSIYVSLIRNLIIPPYGV